MNKNICYGLMLLFVVGLVSAQGSVTLYPEPKDSNLTGLPNAISHVRDNETALHLEQVWAKIQAKRQLQIEKLENITAEKLPDNSTLISGVGEGKFLGLFKAKHKYSYDVLQNGTIVDKPRAFDFLWSKQITG